MLFLFGLLLLLSLAKTSHSATPVTNNCREIVWNRMRERATAYLPLFPLNEVRETLPLFLFVAIANVCSVASFISLRLATQCQSVFKVRRASHVERVNERDSQEHTIYQSTPSMRCLPFQLSSPSSFISFVESFLLAGLLLTMDATSSMLSPSLPLIQFPSGPFLLTSLLVFHFLISSLFICFPFRAVVKEKAFKSSPRRERFKHIQTSVHGYSALHRWENISESLGEIVRVRLRSPSHW